MDEVMTGFGRLGEKFGSDVYGIKPDLLVAGKGLAAGYASITGIYSTTEISDALADAGLGVLFHTFAGLPQSCAAAAKVLSTVLQENGLDRVKKIGP